MSLLRRLVGPRQDRFAYQVIAQLRRAGVTSVHYSRHRYAIDYERGPDGVGSVNLHTAYRPWAVAPPAQRERFVADLVATVTLVPPLPRRREDALPRLRSVLRPVGLPDAAVPGAHVPLARAAWPYLVEMVALDLPDAIVYVHADQCRQWSLTVDEVYRVARDNVAALPLPLRPATGGPSVLRFVDDGDAYFVSRLLLPGWLASLADRVGGRPVAFIPDQDTLMVCAEDPAHLGTVFTLAERDYTGAERPLSPAAYTVDDDGTVVPLHVPPRHPLRPRTSRAAALLSAAAYQEQGLRLDERHRAEGAEVHSGVPIVAAGPSGDVFTAAAWVDGVDTLLPLADYVAFVTGAYQPTLVPWDEVAEQVGLAAAKQLNPPRYRVRTWPPPAVMDRLHRLAVQPQ